MKSTSEPKAPAMRRNMSLTECSWDEFPMNNKFLMFPVVLKISSQKTVTLELSHTILSVKLSCLVGNYAKLPQGMNIKNTVNV